jgi:hypothetical protein
VTTAHNHHGPTKQAADAGRGIAARIRTVGERLSNRIHAAEDDRARALGWEVTEIPGWLGLRGRSYHDPRFAARQRALQDASASRDERHE